MLVALTVVTNRAALDRLFGDFQVDADRAVAFGWGGLNRQFERVQRGPRIAA